jgi:hypothetical protein
LDNNLVTDVTPLLTNIAIQLYSLVDNDGISCVDLDALVAKFGASKVIRPALCQ